MHLHEQEPLRGCSVFHTRKGYGHSPRTFQPGFWDLSPQPQAEFQMSPNETLLFADSVGVRGDGWVGKIIGYEQLNIWSPPVFPGGHQQQPGKCHPHTNSR